MAISARVMVSMFADTSGRLRVRCSVRRDERSIAAGSRRSSTLYCGLNRKSSNVQPRIESENVVTVTGYREATEARPQDVPYEAARQRPFSGAPGVTHCVSRPVPSDRRT